MNRRCANCGYIAEAHAADKTCPGSAGTTGKRFAIMDLPEGKNCHYCHYVKHCCALYGKTPTDTTCDFFPVRFMERPL